MSHLIVLVDGKKDKQESFLRWVKSRGGVHEVNGISSAWNPQIRELKLYDLVMPETVLEEYVADIKALRGYGGCMKDREEKVNSVVKWVGRLFGLRNLEHIKPSKEDVNQGKHKAGMVHPFIIGELKDPHYDSSKMRESQLRDGDEML